MKYVKNTNHDTGQGRSFGLRQVLELAWQGLANHTPVGPGSLATGQSAAAGRTLPFVRQANVGEQSATKPDSTACPRPTTPPTTRPTLRPRTRRQVTFEPQAHCRRVSGPQLTFRPGGNAVWGSA